MGRGDGKLQSQSQYMNKRDLSEADIEAKFITPAIIKAGWDELTQISRQKFFTDGRIYVKGKMTARGKRKFADYILFYKPNIPIAIIESKDNSHSVKAGIQQALGYSNTLDIPFVFSSNGDAFYFHDKTVTDGKISYQLTIFWMVRVIPQINTNYKLKIKNILLTFFFIIGNCSIL
jgi:type I restriction enzyme R subunit